MLHDSFCADGNVNLIGQPNRNLSFFQIGNASQSPSLSLSLKTAKGTLNPRTFMHSSCAGDNVHLDILLFDTSLQLGHIIQTAKDRTAKRQWDPAFTSIYWHHFRRSNRSLEESKRIVHDRLSYLYHEVTTRPGRIMFRCDDPQRICDAGTSEEQQRLFPVYMYPSIESNWINVVGEFDVRQDLR